MLWLMFPALGAAQTLQATHYYSGLGATSARIRIERDGNSPFRPRFEAAGMPATPAFEYFPGLRLPGQKEAFKRPNPPICIVKPDFQLPEQDLGIPDQFDVLFFAEKRLVRFRVHLKSAGETLAERWTKELRHYFDFLDRDGDGTLNRYEAEYAFTPASIVRMMQTGFAYQRPDDAAAMFADMDVNRDGKIQFEEFAAYYAPAANRIITVQANPTRDPYADILTDELFKLLDTDHDGRLSRAELTAIERQFNMLDTDEDDCLSALEIAPRLLSQPAPAGPARASRNSPMMAFRSGALPPSLIETILKRYDQNKNGMLDMSENPFAKAVFHKLDQNRDGQVSVAELAAWGRTTPDLELELTFATKQEQCSIRMMSNKNGVPTSLAAGLKIVGNGTATFAIGNQTVQLAAHSPRSVNGQSRRMNPLAFPDNGKGFIRDQDVIGPQFQGIRVLFDTIDRNADGKVTRGEFDAFFKLQQGFTALPLTLMHSAQTPSLFQVLDANGDGRLSMREVRRRVGSAHRARTQWQRLCDQGCANAPRHFAFRATGGGLWREPGHALFPAGRAPVESRSALVPQIRPQRRRRTLARGVPRDQRAIRSNRHRSRWLYHRRGSRIIRQDGAGQQIPEMTLRSGEESGSLPMQERSTSTNVARHDATTSRLSSDSLSADRTCGHRFCRMASSSPVRECGKE